MANDKNLKVGVSADTRDFSKGMKTAKQDLKDFQKVGDSAMGAIGDAIGVPVAKLEQIGGAAREMGKRLQESGSAGTQALGKLLSGTNALALGIAGVGVAGLTAAFKALNAAADNFLSTVDGLSQKMQMDTWLSTYKQSAFDSNSGFSRTVAAWKAEIKEFSAELGYGIFGGNKAAANEAAYQAHLQSEAIIGLKNSEKELYDLDNKIAAARLQAYDTRNLEDINTLEDLIRQKYALQEPYLKEIYETTKAINATADNTLADVDAENTAYKNWMGLAAQRDSELKSLLRLKKSATTESQAQVEAEDESLRIMKEWKTEMLDIRNDNLDWYLNTSEPTGAGLTAEATTTAGSTLQIPVTPVLDEQGMTDFTEDAKSLVTDALGDMATLLGNAVGDALTGGDVWGNFADDVLSVLADLAIKVGEISIAAGVAIGGIKTALKSLNPAVAIAAGVALVALGAAVKAGLSNAADSAGSTSTSSSSGVASSSYGSSSTMETASITVNVTGQLEARGSSLVAVIDSENNRKKHTT